MFEVYLGQHGELGLTVIISYYVLPQFQGRVYEASPVLLCAAPGACSPDCPGGRFLAPPAPDPAPDSPRCCAGGPVAALHSGFPPAGETL